MQVSAQSSSATCLSPKVRTSLRRRSASRCRPSFPATTGAGACRITANTGGCFSMNAIAPAPAPARALCHEGNHADASGRVIALSECDHAAWVIGVSSERTSRRNPPGVPAYGSAAAAYPDACREPSLAPGPGLRRGPCAAASSAARSAETRSALSRRRRRAAARRKAASDRGFRLGRTAGKRRPLWRRPAVPCAATMRFPHTQGKDGLTKSAGSGRRVESRPGLFPIQCG